jgi:hypothetical protein
MAHAGSSWVALDLVKSGIVIEKREETHHRLGSLFWARTQRVLLMNNRAQAMTAAADITSKSRFMFRAIIRQLATKLAH